MPLIRSPSWGLQKPPVGAPIAARHPLTNGLLRLWLVNEGAGRLINELASGYASTAAAGDTTTVPTWGAQGTVHGGQGYWAPTGPAINTPVASLWVRVRYDGNLAGGLQSPIGFANGFGSAATREKFLYVDSTHTVTGYAWDGGARYVTSSALVVGGWYDIVATWDGSNGRIYLNGILNATATCGNTYVSYTVANIWLGGQATDGTERTWNGIISRAGVWNRALAPAEVAWLYAEPYAMIAPPVPAQGWWVLAQSTGTTLTAPPIDNDARIGAPTVQTAITLTVSPVASTPAVAVPTLAAAQTLTSTPADSPAALGAPALSAAAILAPAAAGDAPTLGAPSLQAAITLASTPVDSSPLLGTPALQAASTLTSSAIDSAAAIGAPALSIAALLALEAIDGAPLLGAPSLQAAITLTASPLATDALVGAPTAQATATLSAAAVEAAPLSGAPILVAASVLTATPCGADAVVGHGTLSTGGATLTASPIANEPLTAMPALTVGTVTLLATPIGSDAAIGTPAVTGSITLAATAIADAPQCGAPTLATDVVLLAANPIPSDPSVGSATLAIGAMTLQATPIPGETPVASGQLAVVLQVTATDGAAITGQPSLLPAAYLQPHGLADGGLIGAPSLQSGAWVLYASPVASAPAVSVAMFLGHVVIQAGRRRAILAPDTARHSIVTAGSPRRGVLTDD